MYLVLRRAVVSLDHLICVETTPQAEDAVHRLHDLSPWLQLWTLDRGVQRALLALNMPVV